MKKYQEILDKLEEMHNQSAKEFIGSNEADLDFKENVARWIESLVKESDSLPCVSCSLQDIQEIIEFLQWEFRKFDKGDMPEETFRMLLMNREKIDKIKFYRNER